MLVPDFAINERDYKLVVADRLSEAREAVEVDAGDWFEKLRHAFGPPNNLTPWQVHDRFLKWAADSREEALDSLKAAWRGQQGPVDRVDAFLAALPGAVVAGPGQRVALASFLQSAMTLASIPSTDQSLFGRPIDWCTMNPKLGLRAAASGTSTSSASWRTSGRKPRSEVSILLIVLTPKAWCGLLCTHRRPPTGPLQTSESSPYFAQAQAATRKIFEVPFYHPRGLQDRAGIRPPSVEITQSLRRSRRLRRAFRRAAESAATRTSQLATLPVRGIGRRFRGSRSWMTA